MSTPTKTIRIEVHLSIGFANSNHRDELEVEVPVDATPEEIEELCARDTEEWANNYIDYGFAIIE